MNREKGASCTEAAGLVCSGRPLEVAVSICCSSSLSDDKNCASVSVRGQGVCNMTEMASQKGLVFDNEWSGRMLSPSAGDGAGTALGAATKDDEHTATPSKH